MVLVSGGSSVGQEDHAPRVLAELGELCVPRRGPAAGEPDAGWASWPRRPVFLLPGNPVSCLCAYDLFAGRAVRRLGGRAATLPYRAARCRWRARSSRRSGRVDYVRVRVRDGQVEPLAISGASILSSTTRADGFVLVPRTAKATPPAQE